jgi:ferredoxin-NADP reductase
VTDARSTEDPPDSLAAAATTPPNRWRKATLIGLHSQSRHSRTLALRVPGWPGHLPGQHVDVRLTAADGYSAQRSYSLAEPATPNRAAITVDLLPHGEVSPYLAETMEVGDELDVRGPIGGWFVWEPGDPAIGNGPVLLIAGGSGVVPLVTMLRARRRAGDLTPTLLVYSLRGPRDLMYGPELQEMSARPDATQADATPGSADVRLVYTRTVPPDHRRPAAHLAVEDLRLPDAWPRPLAARVYVCGPSGFVDHATDLLRRVGYPDDRIRTERFGPTGADR